jgi:microcystin-dependent protein
VATVGYVNAGYIPISGGLPVGTIIMWGGNYTNPPADFLMCSGFPVPVADNPYPLLFAVIGFNYNLAPSTTSWSLPLFNQNRMPISADSNKGANPLSTVVNSAGEVYGGSSTISINQMPSHNHVIECRNAASSGGSSNVVDTGKPNNTQDSNLTGGNAPYAPLFTAVWFLIKYQ